MCGIPKKLHDQIIDAGKAIWISSHEECDGSYVGELAKTKIDFEGKSYEVEIDCYWDRSNYFDYKVTGNGFDYTKLVACWM